MKTRVERPRAPALAVRDRAIIELLYGSGIRRAELAGLDLDDVDLGARVARVTGKGNKSRMVPLTEASAMAMRSYLGVRPGTPTGPSSSAATRSAWGCARSGRSSRTTRTTAGSTARARTRCATRSRRTSSRAAATSRPSEAARAREHLDDASLPRPVDRASAKSVRRGASARPHGVRRRAGGSRRTASVNDDHRSRRAPRGYLGAPVRRREDVRFLTGTATYLDDVEVPNALHVAFVRSPHAPRAAGRRRYRAPRSPRPGSSRSSAHATSRDACCRRRARSRTRRSSTRCTRSSPTTRCATSGKSSRRSSPRAGPRPKTQPSWSAWSTSRSTRWSTCASALASAVQLHAEAPENVVLRYARRSGDVEARVRRRRARRRPDGADPAGRDRPDGDSRRAGRVRSGDRPADALELGAGPAPPSRRARARPRPSRGPHPPHRPRRRRRVRSEELPASPRSSIVAHAAIALRRPVQVDRRPAREFSGGAPRARIEADAELAVAADGRFLAVRAQLFADCGAYVYSSMPNAGHTAATLLTGCYEIGAADVTLLGVATNRVPTSPYRGAGRPEAAIDRWKRWSIWRRASCAAIRSRCGARTSSTRFPYASATGATYDSGDYRGLLDAARRDRGAAAAARGASVGAARGPARRDRRPRCTSSARAAVGKPRPRASSRAAA